MNENVLIVDDDPSICKLLEKILRSNDLLPSIATCGKDALNILKNNTFDAILMDIMLGDMEGFDIVKDLRSHGINTPIMIISGRSEDFDSLYGLSLGADDYITKPFRPVVLGAKIKALIRRNKHLMPANSNMIQCGPFSYNSSTMRFYKENKELISNISHDLKTPITAVKGYVEGIMDGVADTPEKIDRYVKTIYNKTNEMDHLINELTFYSKIDTNRIPYTFSKLNVEDYFSDCAEEVGLELETRGIELVYANYVEDNVQVIADGEQIRRVIHNIISNAIKYMDKPKGIIQIRIKDVGDFIQVEIEDNGKGIAAKDLPSIFDRFYRTDVSRNSSKGGSGIGLSIVKKILEDHGGKVWATSRLGIGTIMYFVLRKYQEVPMK